LYSANLELKMARAQMKTMYLEHRYLVPNSPDQLAIPCQHKSRLFLYDTKLEFDVPTLLDEKYTNHECHPSTANKFLQNAQGHKSPLQLDSSATRSLYLLKVATEQIIEVMNMVRRQHRFFLNGLDSGYVLQA